MSTRETDIIIELSCLEAAHLSALIAQFEEILMPPVSGRRTEDPAIARLVPDAYTEDAGASMEFRSLTESDLLDRRAHDAQTMRATLGPQPEGDALLAVDPSQVMSVSLSPAEVRSWMRTLAAVRLVLATRLGIDDEDDHDHDDPRFGVYDWLGFRLDALVRMVTEDAPLRE